MFVFFCRPGDALLSSEPGAARVIWLLTRWHNPQSPEEGKCLAENAYQKRKQNNLHHKRKKTKHTVLCHCVSSQITLAVPRLGPEEGVGWTTKKRTRKTYSPVPQFSSPITQTMAQY